MPEENAQTSHLQILRSTTIVGGASVINMALGAIRMKSVAVLLGPAGVGLMGLYTSIVGTIGTFAGMGIASSGVRQVAEAVASGDAAKITRTVWTLRRVSVAMGVAGTLAALIAAPRLATTLIGDGRHAWAIATLSFTIVIGSITTGQTVLLQGYRRIRDLARINIFGSILGT